MQKKKNKGSNENCRKNVGLRIFTKKNYVIVKILIRWIGKMRMFTELKAFISCIKSNK